GRALPGVRGGLAALRLPPARRLRALPLAEPPAHALAALARARQLPRALLRRRDPPRDAVGDRVRARLRSVGAVAPLRRGGPRPRAVALHARGGDRPRPRRRAGRGRAPSPPRRGA